MDMRFGRNAFAQFKGRGWPYTPCGVYLVYLSMHPFVLGVQQEFSIECDFSVFVVLLAA